MIYLSAQPDELYFLWQIKLLVFNFKRINIRRENIHILIAYSKEYGLNPLVREYIMQNQDALYFTYEDTRVKKEYPSSIRPHIIYKHFEENPFLEKETIFYHDSDILLKEKLDKLHLLQGEVWYASSTKGYTGIDCIIRTFGEAVFERMCKLINVDREKIEGNALNAGGAQYILKHVKSSFWKKMEEDCELVYSYLLTFAHTDYPFNDTPNNAKTQAWYTDM